MNFVKKKIKACSSENNVTLYVHSPLISAAAKIWK